MKRRSFLQMLAALAGIPFLPKTAAKPVQNPLAGPFVPVGFQGPVGPASLGVPVGTVQPYMGNHAPLGWLPCDGRVISAHEFPALHALIGQPGKVPFALPEMRANHGLAQQNGLSQFHDFTTLQYIIKT
jgi:hypothetical protein